MDTLSLGDALFTATQQKVLALLYGKPDRSFYANEIARWAQVGKGSVMRELDRMQKAGVLVLTQQGNQTHYLANAQCPIYAELLGIVRKTFGVAEHLRAALAPLVGKLHWAFVYGSIAKGTAHSGSDIDLMLIGEGVNYSDVMTLLMPVEEQLGRTINPTLYTKATWQAQHKTDDNFVQRLAQQEKIDIIGSNLMEPTDGR